MQTYGKNHNFCVCLQGYGKNAVMKKIAILLFLAAALQPLFAFDYADGRASLSPYPSGRSVREYPDSLTPVFVNHVGRHGSRYPAGPLHTMMMMRALDKADSLRTITPLGRALRADVGRVADVTAGRWGALDSIGEDEHRGIAGRLYGSFPQLFDSARVVAVSSYSPRSVMSMYSFLHKLSESAKDIEVSAASGKRFNRLVRNFDEDDAYKEFRSDTAYLSAYNRFLAKNISINPLLRVLGEDFPLDYKEAPELALAEYYVLAGMDAMGLHADASEYFTEDEFRKMWSIFNFRQYLLYSASVLSPRPAEIAGPLLQDLVSVADSVLGGKLPIAAKFRFGHAETLMPLMSLLQAPGCYYLTNYFDTVADEWKDYASFPMAANLQLVYFKSESGKIYVRADFNERPIRLLPGEESDYVGWDELRLRFLELLPLD